jgi:hypothetical protein
VKRFMISAVAYDKDGKRLSGNTHAIDAETQRDAIQIAESRQRVVAGTVRVETKVNAVYDKR